MDPLPPIPTPLSQHWREIRIRVMPIIVFVLLVTGITFLWRHGISGYLSGVAEGVRSTVTSPQIGVLHQLNVQPYQVVKMGDPIAVLLPRDPKVALDLLQSKLAISRLRLQPTVAEQNVMNFEQIRVDLLRTKSELAVARVNLAHAASEVRRNTPLYKEKLVSEDLYELSVKTHDMYQAEVDTKSKTIREIERRLQELSSYGVPQSPSSNDLAQAMIAQLEGMHVAAATNWGPIVLRAPISGMISIVYRQQGENVMEGEPLIAINSDWADRIVGYLRQPYAIEPQVGLGVMVTTREKKMRTFWTEITQVGAQLETITNTLAYIRQGSLLDAGLPVVIDVPKGLRLRPGEVVDLVFKPKPAGTDEALPPPILDSASAAKHAAHPRIE
jgi:multidrug resistance efflux pump